MGRTIALTPFFNELDVLEIRLATLDPVVDIHVIAEAPVTFAGHKKRLILRDHWDRFEPWHDKIRYVEVGGMPRGASVRAEPGVATTACDSDNWLREKHQRAALVAGLHDLEPDDLLFLSDLDEIPNPACFQGGRALAQMGYIARPRLAMHVYRLRWRWEQPLPVIARFFTPATLEQHGRDLEAVRQQEGHPWGSDLGWHLAYMGGIEAIRYKLAEAAHHELNTPEFTDPAHVQRSIMAGADIFNRANRQAVPCPPDELPPYVQANHDRFEHLI